MLDTLIMHSFQYSKRQLLQLHKEELAKLKQQGEQKVMLQQQSEEQRKHEAKLQQQLSEVIIMFCSRLGAMWIKNWLENKSKLVIHSTDYRLGKQM